MILSKVCRAHRGMSLVEATIILAILALLTSVLAPSINDLVNDAKDTKCKEDVEAIGVSIFREWKDIGSQFTCLVTNVSFAPGEPCPYNVRVDLLISEGNQPGQGSAATDFTPPSGTTGNPQANWQFSGVTPVIDTSARTDTMENQLVRNTPGGLSGSYDVPTFNTGGPQFGLGWRGAYIPSPIGPDPWGHMYEANTMFLAVATNSGVTGGGEGAEDGGWNRDTIVVCASRNGSIDTKWDGSSGYGTIVGADDVVYVISGGTR